MELLVNHVVTLDELHNPAVLTVDSSMVAQTLGNASHYIQWDKFRRYLKAIKLASNFFLSTDALDISNEAFSNILKMTR